MITPETRPLYLERKIAQELGLTRDEFRHVRTSLLKKKRDWDELERNTVLTGAAVERVIAHLQKAGTITAGDVDLAPCLYESAEEKKSAAQSAEQAGLVELTVFKLEPNPVLLRAKDPAGAVVTVRVLNNTNFRPRDHRGRPMTLRGRCERPGVYVMEGPCPRFPGRY